MRRALVVFGAFALLLAACSQSHAHFRPHGRFGISFTVFYESLSPHGEWIAVGGGVYGWRPLHVVHGWRPYTFGRWVWTDEGWYWVSDEPWGWAAYHYGRWYYDDYYGWIWIPGYEWAPAWVEWRYGGDYIGWAPLGPYAIFSISIGIHYRTHWVTPHHYWTFVGCRYLPAPSVYRYRYRQEHNARYIGRTRHAGSVRSDGGRIVTHGPDRGYIEDRGRIRVERMEIRDVDSRERVGVVRNGDREQIAAYRPSIDHRTDDTRAERPARLREVERKIDLDTRNTDVRALEEDRSSGRDVGRSQDHRIHREETQRTDRPDRQRSDEPRSSQERSEHRRSDDRPSGTDRRDDSGMDIRRVPRPERQVDRRPDEHRREAEELQRPQPRREEVRSPRPERTERRPEVRQESRSNPERSAPQRSGGSRSDRPPRDDRQRR